MSSGSGRRSSRGRTPPPSSISSAALQATVSNTHRHRQDRSRSRSPHDGVQRTESSRSTTSYAGSSRVGSSREGASRNGTARNGTARNGTARPNRNIEISHILIKHKDISNPIDNNNKPVTRTKDQAMYKVIDIHEKISKDLITFADAAVSYSDCKSARRQGDIQEQFQTGRVLKSFEDAALTLAPGQMSHVIESNSGYHILQRRE